MSTPEDRPYSPLRSQEDITLLLRMLLSFAHNPIGPSMQADGWRIDYQMGTWCSYPMGKPDTEVRLHDTLAEALRRTGDERLARILEWASREVSNALSGMPEHIGLSMWPPPAPLLREVLQGIHPTAIVQEVRVHPTRYNTLTRLWKKTNTGATHFDRHRPFPYARVVATGQSPMSSRPSSSNRGTPPARPTAR